MGRKARSQPVQLTFDDELGIHRKGGRKKSPDSGVSHLKREAITKHVPAHATAKLAEGLPSLREWESFGVIWGAFADGRERAGRREDGEFRLVEYSVQDDHIHLLVEASDPDALARGMAGLKIRIAKRLNKLWGRSGPVWKERYHMRLLRTPREVWNALRYIFGNARRHGLRVPRGVPDQRSSGVWFEGWCDYDHLVDDQVTGRPPTARARSWLRRVGWRRHGWMAVP